MNRPLADALGICLGYAADRRFGDPRRLHPVAGFGRWALWCERQLYRPNKLAGATYLMVAVAPWVGIAALSGRAPNPVRLVMTSLTTWAALGGRSLEREGMAVYDHIVAGDLPAARERIKSLVGRDTREASSDDLARAVVESLAENQSDAVAATLVAGALGGPAAVVAHRCVNTLDAMVGYRNDRYSDFGWASAKIDDVLNWLPARVSTVVTAAVAYRDQGRPGLEAVMETVRRDARHHPSPNAGWVEAATAAALGVRLGGVNTYEGVSEDRGFLGDGRAIVPADIQDAARLTRRVGLGVLGVSVSSAMLRAALPSATRALRQAH